MNISEFEIEETYMWHDGPVLYLARRNKQAYLGLTWEKCIDILIPVSEQRIKDLENCKVGIVGTFLESEEKEVYIIGVCEDSSCRKMNVSDLSREDFAGEEFYIDELDGF